MRYRRLEGVENEPVYGRGKQDFLIDVEAVGQAVMTRLKLFRGEWWEDIYFGIPMWQEILGVVGARKDVIDRVIQKEILDTTGVFNIDQLASVFNRDSRAYQFYAVINTIYGRTVLTNAQGEIQR
jgi:hypothetical protein